MRPFTPVALRAEIMKHADGPLWEDLQRVVLFATTDPKASKLDGAPLRDRIIEFVVPELDDKQLIWELWRKAGIATADAANAGQNGRPGGPIPLESLSTAQLFAAQDLKVEWLAWPFAAAGLSSILDALPKLGKTRFILEAIKASRDGRTFLGHATLPIRVIYVSEQSTASLAMQAREVGFTGDEPIEELRWITREHWSRVVFTDLLAQAEKMAAGYNCLVFDTWHTVARLENENDAAEVNRLGNLALDLAAQHKLALVLSRHDRKSGGDIGLSGRSSIQLSGLVDVILHLLRLPGQAAPTQRKLELLARVPGLPNEQIIELTKKGYLNYGHAEGGVETTRAAEEILKRAPNQKESATTITEILKGTGFAWSQPVRDAIARLDGKKQLRQRTVKRGKKKVALYWTEELVLRGEKEEL